MILVSGTPRSVDDGKNQLNFFRNHVLGLSAPAGGLIFIVPSDLICRMPIMEQNFRTLPQRFPGAQISKVYHGRIQVTGNNQPEVVGQLLRWVDYRGRVLFLGPAMGCFVSGKNVSSLFCFHPINAKPEKTHSRDSKQPFPLGFIKSSGFASLVPVIPN